MKKLYIRPNQTVHHISLKDGILETINLGSTMTTLDTFGARDNYSDADESSSDNSSSIWSNEW